MQTQYIDYQGNEISHDAIKAAVANGTARLVCGRGNGRTNTSFALNVTKDWDTRGGCYSVWDESWTVPPKDLQAALAAARTTA